MGWTMSDAPTIREATAGDLSAIVALLADDTIGRSRERDPTELAAYAAAFEAIAGDPAHRLVVLVHEGRVAGCLQLSIIPGLSRGGMQRGQIEGVRVARELRGTGAGSSLIRWAIDESRRLGCGMVQLTTDKQRTEAHRFYERLGFTASHEGMKLLL